MTAGGKRRRTPLRRRVAPTPGMRALAETVDMLTEELDCLIGKACRNAPVLTLTHCYPDGTRREWSKRYKVVDRANGGAVMTPAVHLDFALRFATAFVEKHPEAQLDGAFGLFATTPTGSGEGEPASRIAASPEQFSVRVPSARVIPFPIKEPA